jgi:hypothetical protein
MSFDEGQGMLEEWLRDDSLKFIGDIIGKEMDSVKAAFTMGIDAITPKFLDDWTFETNVGCVARAEVPFLFEILCDASQTRVAQVKNKIKKADDVSFFLFPRRFSV